jgi:hypothetical protein
MDKRCEKQQIDPDFGWTNAHVVEIAQHVPDAVVETTVQGSEEYVSYDLENLARGALGSWFDLTEVADERVKSHV